MKDPVPPAETPLVPPAGTDDNDGSETPPESVKVELTKEAYDNLAAAARIAKKNEKEAEELRKYKADAEAAAKEKLRNEDIQKFNLKEAEDLAAERQKLEQERNELKQQKAQNVIAAEASKLGFIDPEDAALFLGDIDGEDREHVRAKLSDLLQSKPHLGKHKMPRVPDPAPNSGGTGNNTTVDTSSMSQSQLVAHAEAELRKKML